MCLFETETLYINMFITYNTLNGCEVSFLYFNVKLTYLTLADFWSETRRKKKERVETGTSRKKKSKQCNFNKKVNNVCTTNFLNYFDIGSFTLLKMSKYIFLNKMSVWRPGWSYRRRNVTHLRRSDWGHGKDRTEDKTQWDMIQWLRRCLCISGTTSESLHFLRVAYVVCLKGVDEWG